jgi:hypothetical protein
MCQDPEQLSRYSDWLWAGRSGRSGFDYGRGIGIFTSSPRPDRLWGSHSLLSNR